MDELFWQGIDFLMCAIETFLLFLLCERFLRRDAARGTTEVLISCIAITCLSFGMSMVTPFAMWKTLIGIMSIFCFCFFLYEGTPKEKLLCTVIYFSILAFSDAIAGLCVSAVVHKDYWSVLEANNLHKVFLFSLSKTLSVLIITLISTFSSRNRGSLPRGFWNAFICLFAFVLTAIVLTIDWVVIEVQNTKIMAIIAALILTILVFYLFTYFCFCYLSDYFLMRSQSSMLAYERDMIEKYLAQKINADLEMKILSHDFNNVLIGWKDLAEKRDYAALEQGISRYVATAKEKTLKDFNNTTANAIINQKILLAREKNLRLVATGIFYDTLTLDQVDLCALLGNIIDNALEAAEKLDAANERTIRLHIDRKEDYLLLSCENPYVGQMKKKSALFPTTKGDPLRHGLGLISVQKIIERNNGIMEITTDGGIFRLTAMLDVYSEIAD